MKIRIITVGKIKETYLVEAIKDYQRRLEPYCKLSFIEIAEEKISDKATKKEIEKHLEKEGEKILAKAANDFVIALAIQGKEFSSEAFSSFLENLSIYQSFNLCFVIGSSYGLAENVYQRADYLLSFSKLTFPHQMMRLILLEQIYRYYKIKNNEPYHK